MLRKLKSKSGMGFVLVMIFWNLMIILTGFVMNLNFTESQSIHSLQESEYNYFISKAALNHYAEILNGLQYVETEATQPFDSFISNTLDYKVGNFQFVDDTGALLDDKLTVFSKLVNVTDLEKSFGYFQTLRTRVLNGTTALTTVDTAYIKPHQVFEITIVNDNFLNESYMGNDMKLTTTITFYGQTVSYDGFNSHNENTARVKVSLSTDVSYYDYTTNSSTIAYDENVYSHTISCAPTLDETSGSKVWTWETFS